MPIFDIQAKAEPTFPRLGKIRKGGKKQSNRPGADLQHFRLDDAEDVAEAYEKLYGTREPQEMGILLPFDDMDRVFRAFHELYTGGTLLCQGDGQRVQYMRHPNTGNLLVRGGFAVCDFETTGRSFCRGEEVPCPGMNHDLYSICQQCKPHGYLMAIVPEVRRFGYYEFTTTSFYDILNLTANLKAIMQLNRGRLTGVPLVIRRVPTMIPTPGSNGKRVRREKWLLHIEAAPGWVEQLQNKWEALREPGNGHAVAMLDAPEVEDDEDEDDGVVEAEYAEADAEPEPAVETHAVTLQVASEYLATLAGGEAAPKGYQGSVANLLSEAIGGKKNEPERHAILEALTGEQSTSKLSMGQAKQLIKWLVPQEKRDNNDWSVGDNERKMVASWMRELRLSQGQQEMPLADDGNGKDPRPEHLRQAVQEAF